MAVLIRLAISRKGNLETMQTQSLLRPIAAGTLALFAIAAHAEGPTYFISPMVGVAYSDFDDNHTGGAAHLGFGVNLTPRVSMEVKGFYSELDIDEVNLYRQKGASIDTLYKVVKRPGWEMYTVAGLGFVRQDVPPGGNGTGSGDDDTVDPVFDLGLGFLFPMNSISTALRTDLRYRNDYHGDADTYGQSSFYQLFAQVGLLFPYRSEEPQQVAVYVPPPVAPMPQDSDGDGVIDSLDECPNTPAGMAVLPNGCSVDKDVVLEGVHFEFNSAKLTRNAEAVLDDVADTIKATPGIKLEVAGHTDDVGNARYNQRLSEERARSVVNYLVRQGVPRNRLTAIGYGEAKPIASNATDSGRAENRRVELNPEKSGNASAEVPATVRQVTERAQAALNSAAAMNGQASLQAAQPEIFLGFAGRHLTSSARRALDGVARDLLAGKQQLALTVEGDATAEQAAAIQQYLITRGVRGNRLKAGNDGSEIQLQYAF